MSGSRSVAGASLSICVQCGGQPRVPQAEQNDMRAAERTFQVPPRAASARGEDRVGANLVKIKKIKKRLIPVGMGFVTRSDSCVCIADRNASSKYPPLAVPPVVRIVLMQTRGIYMVGRVGSEHGLESE